MGKDSSINLTPGRVRMTGSGGKREKLSAWIWCVCFLGASLLLVFWIVSMMALEVEQPQLLAAVLCLDAWYMVVFLSGKLIKVLVPVSAGIIAGFLFWQRDALRRGLTVIVNLYSRYIQDHYAQGPGFLASEEGPVSLLPALVAISAVLLFFLGYSILRRRRAGMLFFLMIVLLCAGLTVNRFPHPVILLGSIVFCLGIRAMNGRGSGEAGQRMQVRTGILALLLAGAAAAVSFFVLGPALSERILPLHTQVQTFQRQMEADVGEAMERITSGRWSFTGSWSGMVESGMLSNSAAQRDNTEALRLTVSRQPSETVYLKGFVGGLYQGNYWQEISDEDFQSAVESWSSLPEGVSTEEYRELLQQYPYWWQEALGRQPDFFRLELANVNGSYAYLPYFSSLTGDQAPDLTADVEISFEEAAFGCRKVIRLQDGQSKVQSLEVNIPAGIEDGKSIRLKGKGQPGTGGGQPGSLQLLRRLVYRKKNFPLYGQAREPCPCGNRRQAVQSAQAVLHGIFNIENQGDAHPVLVQQARIGLALRVALDGAVRLGADIPAQHIGKIIVPAECTPLTQPAHNHHAHARRNLCADFTELSAILFIQALCPSALLGQAPQNPVHILFSLIHTKAYGTHKFVHAVTFFLFRQ